ncbi:MAG: sulfatase [Bacteroidales bacterium]|nr:sulfatase [Bacteroidales bacterium]
MKKVLLVIVLVGILAPCIAQQPNIVILYVDDLGWADLGYRKSLFETPNVDKLAGEGANFERAYVSSPTCSPSRASMLTGKEPVRFQMVRHILEEDGKWGSIDGDYNLWKRDPAQMPSINYLPLEEVTYAERLRELGYYNMFIGKWHLGTGQYYPQYQGFDEVFGCSDYGHPKSYYQPFFTNNPLEEIPDELYLTDVLTDKAESFIANYKEDKPFMLNLWYYNVHGPHVGRKDLLEKYKQKGMNERYANYGAMVEVMDESVGRVRAALEKKGIADNTLILFTSDQGGYFTNYPLRGKKNGGHTLNEGGARVPFIIYYPGVTANGVVVETPVQTIDVYPTLLEIASADSITDNVSGVSLMRLLKGQAIEDRALYFYRSYEDQYAAIIEGDWKLIKYRSGKVQLYNVVDDKGEVNNLEFVYPERAKSMKSKLSAWEEEAVPVF